MKTPIYLEDAIDAIDALHDKPNSWLDYAVETIKKLPPAEPERKTGRWIPVTNGRDGHECDQCHEYAPSWATGEEHLTNFCPNCGVKMEVQKCD